uniref:Uncharacterized protein n=1 Tax=Arundo donax TaxID=35708 RepID=A0A0A9BB15_ARUDO
MKTARKLRFSKLPSRFGFIFEWFTEASIIAIFSFRSISSIFYSILSDFVNLASGPSTVPILLEGE